MYPRDGTERIWASPRAITPFGAKSGKWKLEDGKELMMIFWQLFADLLALSCLTASLTRVAEDGYRKLEEKA